MITSSKSCQFITHILLLLVLGFSSGCMRSEKHDPKVKADLVFGDNADFDILKVDARPLNQENSLYKVKGWKVPFYKNYEFIVTLRDGLQGRSMRDFYFKVLDPNGTPVCDANSTPENPKCDYRANASSEIRWIEKVPYDFFKRDSNSVLFVRKIKGTGGRTGQRTVVVEINPWSTMRGLNVPEVRDITFNLSEEQAEKIKQKDYTPLTGLKINSTEEGQKAKVMVDSIDTQMLKSIEPFIARNANDQIISKVSEDSEGNITFQNLLYSRYRPEEFVSMQAKNDIEGEFQFLKKVNNAKVYVYENVASPQHIDGIKFTFDLKMNLKYEFIKPEGPTDNRPLMDGRFKILSTLVLEASDGERPIILTPNMNTVNGEIFEGRLYANYQALIPYIPSTGNIKLALRLIPLGLEDQLTNVDYLFTLGSYKNLLGRNGGLFPDERTIKRVFNYDDYIRSAQGGEKVIENGYAYKVRDFSFGTMDIKFSTVEAGETASQRTVIFRVKAKVFDEATGAVANANTPFEIVSLHSDLTDPNDKSKWKFYRITNAESPKDPSRVNREGDIFWYDKMTHKYYHKEKLVERRVFITRWKPSFKNLDFVEEVKKYVSGQPTNSEVKIQELKMYINPWDEKFGTFGTDASIASDSFIHNIESREKIESRFFIGNFRYETLRFRYGIDKSMNLNVKKTVLLTLDPLVLRYSSILQGINSVDRIRDGIYILKAALQKDYLDPSARDYVLADEEEQANLPEMIIDAQNGQSKVLYDGREVGGPHQIPYGDPRRKRSITFVKKLVRVNAGKIITPVEFSIDDLRLMRIRSQFFVQLELVNQVKLQVVNIIKERFEKLFQFETGKNSPILSRLSPQEQARIKYQIQKTLDVIADNIDDDIYVNQIEDLEAIIQNPNIQRAIQDLESSRLGDLVKDILIDLKREFEGVLAKRRSSINDENIDEVIKEHQNEMAERERDGQALAEAGKRIAENPIDPLTQGLKDDQCETLNPVTVIPNTGEIKFDPNKETENIDQMSMAYVPFDTGVFPDDYSDRLSKFQPFQNNGKQFFQSLVNENTLNRILTNDFTISPAFGPVSDLDKLIDRKSGIKGRTFVGPMTFLYNTNSGSLRPTDNLDEAYCVTDDCNSLNTALSTQYGVIENFEYEKSPYHGSIAHFQNVVFEDQILQTDSGQTIKIEGIESMHNKLQAEQSAREVVDGLTTRFLDQYDLSYLSLRDIAPDRLVCKDNILKGSHCFTKDKERFIPVDDFINSYTDVVRDIVDADYKNKNQMEVKYQNLYKQYNRFSNASTRNLQTSLPYGFLMPSEGIGMERCEQSGINSSVCDAKNASPGFIYGTNYEVDLDYKAPTKEELMALVKQPYQGNTMVSAGHAKFNNVDKARMCDFLVYGDIARRAYKRVVNEDQRKRLRADLFSLATFCKIDIQNGIEPLALERRFKINETGRYYFLGGKSMNINASQDVKLSSSLRVTRAFGVRPLRLITGLIEKGATFVSKGVGLLLGSFDFTYNLSRDKSFNEGTGITKGTYLVMQNAEFEIELKSYEQCVVVRWNPEFVAQRGQYLGFVDGEFSEDIVSGMFICSGVLENTPIAVKEKYYYFTQHFTEGDMLDPADIHNHPWLLSLRGVRDFNTFMLALQAYEDTSSGKKEKKYVNADQMIGYFDMMKNDITNVKRRLNNDYNPTDHYDTVKRKDWPIDHMVQTYNRTMPTVPGMYSQLDAQDYYERSWPWKESEPGTIMQTNSKVCR